MTDNELDNLFKNTFNNHETPIPADMWQRIQPGGAKRRPVVLWWKWYAAAAVFLIAGTAIWWKANIAGADNNKIASYNTSKQENKSKTNQDVGVKNDTNTYLQQNNSSDNKQTNIKKVTSNEQQLASLSHSINEKEIQSGKSFLSESASNSPNVGELYTSDLISKGYAAKPSNNEYNSSANSQNNSHNLEKAQTPLNSITENKDNTIVNNDNKSQQNTPANNTSKTIISDPKKNNKKSKLPWTIEFFATTAYAQKQTYDLVKENPIFGAAPVPPPQPKPSLWNYGAGVRLGIPISEKITFKTGLQLAQTIQKADYQQQNVVDMIAINGTDTSFYRQIVLETEEQKSTYTSLSIPVLVSYQTGKKIQVGATAGVIVNAYSWYSGQVPNADYTATLSAKETYKHNTGAALYAGVTIAKKLGTVEIYAEPHLQYSLNSITKPTVPFKQKINTYGLSIGVRTSLHK